MFAVDVHTHTRFFHGFESRPTPVDPVGARALAVVARYRGLDGVAFTNHDYTADFAVPGLVTIPGIEVSTTRGHVLVIGPDPPAATRVGGMTPAEVVDLAHQRDCAAIVAHPYRNSTVRAVEAPFDAIEINGKHPRTRDSVERLAEGHDLPTVGGSDAHYPFEVGRAHTLVDADELTPAAVVDAIRDCRVAPRVDTWLPHSLLRALYRRIHSEKGHLTEPEWLSPGVGSPPGEE
ncbi:PHP domain-containing protein [Halorientalis pallida]|uniref:PHP domain-containing protein n=1 Tax=Halorientalis pallida TaxID=2479928 RepID=A0A498L1H5_9EURY|nr:PHP-associated domain-containing protein [Halorientalis pallida]RXK51836.1 PHP domain-containing protein [Halorientalis pallida]